MVLGTHVDGRTVGYDESAGALDIGGTPVTPEQMRAFVASGQVVWASDEIRLWFEHAFPTATPTPVPSPTQKKRPIGLIIGVAAAVLLLGCGACTVLSALTSNSKSGESTPAASQPVPAAPAPATPETVAPAPEPEPVPEPAPKWTVVSKLAGSANKRGGTFHLSGNDARLTYTVTGKSSPVCGIYVMEKGASLQKDGGFPEVMVSDAGKDSTMLSKSEGDYYLDVTSANCKWTVTIEELR